MRFSQILVAYFVIGAVMWGGGVISWDQSGVATVFIDSPNSEAGPEVNEETSGLLESLGGPILEATQSIGGGGLAATWNALAKFVGYLFWPITTMLSVGAPPRWTIVLGGTPTVAFFGTFLRLIRSSA
jgi:hypothetical protein